MKKRLNKKLIAGLIMTASFLGSSSLAFASDVKIDDLINAAGSRAQTEFDLLSRDIGRMIFLNPGNSPEPLGLLGFNAGAQVSFSKVDTAPFKSATGQNIPGSMLPVPSLRAQKGLPWGIDIGVVYLPEFNELNVGMMGAEARIDLLEFFPLPTPLLHLSARGSYTKLTGVSELELNTFGYDLSGGVNFPIIKPYAGVGVINIRSTPQGTAALLLSEANSSHTNLFAGVKLKIIPFVPINIEYSNALFETYSIKVGVEF
jgi:hypothetical protein